MDRLFPADEKFHFLQMVSNMTTWQQSAVIRFLSVPVYLGLTEEQMGRPSLYEKRLQLVKLFMRNRVSTNSQGRKNIVDSLQALMLNELRTSSNRLGQLLGKV